MMKRLEFLYVLLCGLLLISPVSAFQHSHEAELPDLDRRKAKVTQRSAEQLAATKRLKATLPEAQIEVDEITGTPKLISTRNGFLSGKNGMGRGISTNAIATLGRNETHRATKAFIREHKELFGHGPEALSEARIKRDYRTKHNGLQTTIWQQELEGIPIFEALFVSHVTKDEELVNLSSRFVPDPAQAADRGVKNQKGVLAKPSISAKRAIGIAAHHLGVEVSVEAVEELGSTQSEPRRQKFRSAKLPGDTYAELVWLPIHADELRLCWQIVLTRPEHGDMFLVLVDAQNGEMMVRRGLTRAISEASYHVFTSESPTPMSPGHSAPFTDQPPLVARELVTLTASNTNASPVGWIAEGVNETFGNNVEAHLDHNGDNIPDLPRPQGSPFRVFDMPQDLGQSPGTYDDASVVQVFYWCNWMHDRLYELGFTEEAGNFQQDNFGKGGIGGDPVQADAQDNLNGVSRNNANFSTPPDGIPGRMQMLIYTRSDSSVDRDPALDAQIVLHEYTHGMSDRLVGGGMGMTHVQSRGMAEGWSDFYALALLSHPTNDVHANYPFGAYVAQKLFPAGFFELNYYYGTRRYPYSTAMTKNPLTFKDIDPAQIGSYPSVPRASMNSHIASNADAVHNQGEIWCVALWEARANLITKHGFSAGNELILQLVTDGMKLCPPNPTFLQSRDAILLADQINHNGANHPELWAAFAKRGMGFFATSPSSNTTSGVVESFALPDDLSIRPEAGMISSGPTGGPFLPNSKTFGLTNFSSGTLTWSIQGVADWLSISSSGGTLPASNGVEVTFSISQSVAGNLPKGFYTNNVAFMNATTGASQTRRFILRIGQPDAFTESFELNDFDLSHQSFTFTPNNSDSFYSVCREAVADFPSDPTGGTFLPLGDDGFEKITIPASVSFYGNSAIDLFIGSNGYITFGSGDAAHENTPITHFTRRRISALFTDLVPPTNSISWKVFTNRVAVTYLNVAEYGTSRTNSFQVELFFDNRIRISYLQMETQNGLVGFSRGTGLPASFVESDFSNYLECGPAVQVSVPASASESDGMITGEVSIHSPLTTNLIVNLFSSDNSQATVPFQVILPAPQTSVAFDITIVDDEALDGTQPVTITAAAAGFPNGMDTVRIDDNEQATLSVSLPDEINEGAGIIHGVVFIQDFNAAADVEVELSSIDPFRLVIPASVTIPAGQSSVNFQATVLDNNNIDGDSLSIVTAYVTGWFEGSAVLTIRDDEDRNLRLRLPTTAREGNGTLPQAGSVHISGALPGDLVVALNSDLSAELSLPASILIPAGNTFATFDLTIGDDATLDGATSVQVTASANEFIDVQESILVEDDETPLPASNPHPADLSSNNPVIIELGWDPSPGEGVEQLTNGDFELGTTSGWTLQTNGNSFTLFSGNYSGGNFGTPATAFAGYYSLAATQTNTGTQTLVRQVTLPDVEVLTVSWADLIRNGLGTFSSNHQYRVELRDANDATLDLLFFTETNSPPSTDWTSRTFNISHHRGTTVQLAFVIETISPGLTVLMDNICIRAANPPQTTYDVYFGTNASLDISSLVGSTTNLTWELPLLDPLSTYFWKIVSRRMGEVSSPVWEFQTRGNSAPVISPIADQFVYANGSLTLTIAAVDHDTPPDSLTYSLSGTPPSGASIHSTSGVFTWPGITAPIGSTNMISVQVQDNGSPNLTASQTFAVIVVSSPAIQAVSLVDNELTLHWSAISGHTYRVQYKTDLLASEWEDLGDVTAQDDAASLTDVLSDEEQKFYRVLVLP